MAKTNVKTSDLPKVKTAKKVSQPYQRARGGGAELVKNVK
jgi:hypothetical protein